MKILKIVFLLPMLIFTLGAFAQEEHFDKNSVHPCGTPTILYDFEKDRISIPSINRGDSITYIGLSLHNVGSDNGTGFLATGKILDGLCRLNQDYAPTKIQFFILGDIHYLKSTKWNSHDSVLAGADMMLTNNIPNSINCYFNSKAAGNAGYNLPYGGVSLLKGIINSNDHTWAHELGHSLSLQHPFLGWEGKQYNNTFYANPAPQKVTYDYTYFKDSLITDKTIIDTAWVELMDSTNCSYAADMVCDSRPDYLAYRWTCNAQGVSTQLQKDPNGVDFRSDGSLIMSYSDDACQKRFTDGQINRMHFYIDWKKKNTVYPRSTPLEIGNLIFTSPIDSQIVQYNNVNLNWEPTANATHYIIQVSLFSTFSILQVDTVVKSNFLNIKNLLKDRTYFWRIRPFSHDYFCTKFSGIEAFRTKDISSVIDLPEVQVRFFPNPAPINAPVQYKINSDGNKDIRIELYSVDGQKLKVLTLENISGEVVGDLGITLTAGVYFVQVSDGKQVKTDKIVVK